jgi:hypothetical protein
VKLTCVPQMTLYSSIFASPSRVGLAHRSGFSFLTATNCAFLAGWHADKVTLITAHELGLQYTHEVVYGAARAGDLDKLKWLYTEQPCELSNHQHLCDHAAIGGSIAVLAWLKQQGVTLTEEACTAAARHCQLPVLQYLHAEGVSMSEHVRHLAAASGDLVMLKWAHEHICSSYDDDDDDICRAAAQSGNVELMAWLLEQPGIQLTAEAMQEAAESRHRAMCEFLYTNYCPWDKHCCLLAAQRIAKHGDDAELLRWLRQHGCPWWPQDVAYQAAYDDSVALLEFMQQDGFVFTTEQLTEMLSSAGAFDSLITAKWLRDQSAEWPTVLQDLSMYSNGKQWYGDILAWARAEGCTAPLSIY